MARPKGEFRQGWKYYDRLEHAKHLAFLRQRAQANFRKEGWELTIEQFFSMWTDELWAERGRKPLNYCMVRRDIEKPWSRENCLIITRYQQLVRNKTPRRNPTQGFPEHL